MNRSERKLGRLVSSYFKTARDFGLHPAKTQCISELRTLQGRPDIVAFNLSPSLRKKNQLGKIGRSMSTHTAATILATLSLTKGTTIERLLIDVPFTARSIEKALQDLRSSKLLTLQNGSVRGTKLLNRISVPLIAVEAKRRASTRALFQAKQYRSFAARSFLAVWYEDGKRQLEALARRTAPVGLIGVRYDGSVIIARRGLNKRPRNRVAYYYALGNALSGRSVRQSGFVVL